MFALFTIPPLPPGWPYTSREAGGLRERILDASIDGLGSGWTLCLREPAPLGGHASELPHAFGRGGIQRIGDLVVRPYRRGGLVRYANERLYLSPARFAREFAVHQALWAAGFPTVEPLGYGFRRRWWGVEGVYFTRFVEAAAWPTCWGRSPRALPQIKTLLESLAAWGLHAPDLNATNILLAGDDRVLALDWDRARWVEGEDLRDCYRERLERSLRKLHAPEAILDAFATSLAK